MERRGVFKTRNGENGTPGNSQCGMLVSDVWGTLTINEPFPKVYVTKAIFVNPTLPIWALSSLMLTFSTNVRIQIYASSVMNKNISAPRD